jgi:hypothetical protein
VLTLPPIGGTIESASLLGGQSPLKVNKTPSGLTITLPPRPPNPIASVIALETS